MLLFYFKYIFTIENKIIINNILVIIKKTYSTG